jgi:DNA invertase Pin-like site-specific DNA recombinase
LTVGKEDVLKQSKGRKGREYTAALYPRLSRDDNLEGESYSIANQKQLLTKVAKEMGYTNLITFVDDGVSGVTMNRPGFNQMMEELDKGYISAVFVKDMSRLGRNYIEVGKLTEEYFPEHDIRLVAVSDGIDTNEGENELAPIRNLFNEWYARDISKKRRISNKIRGNSGIPLCQPPYGYMKDEECSQRWIVDDEAAGVVKRIFDMTIEGYGSEQIAKVLTEEKIETPVFYWRSRGIKRPGRTPDRSPFLWNSSSIGKILSMQEYCGDLINFKTYTKSYKNKKQIQNDPENWVIFKDVHEPIIEREVWQRIQDKRGSKRKRKTKDGETNMFSGLLVCADCGKNMWFHFNQGNHDIKYFNCSNYKGNHTGTCSSTHYIRVDFLEQVVLGEIRRLTRFASKYENEFAQIVMGHSKNVVEFEHEKKQKDLRLMVARNDEIDGLYEKMYEDNVSGKITDERFYSMSVRYEGEQAELLEKIKTLKSEIDTKASKAVTADMFISTVRKYTRAKTLTRRMLNELIERIEVHQSEKIDGEHRQKLTIHYNCIGTMEIPDILKLPETDVRIQTRRGVAVRFEQDGMGEVDHIRRSASS